MVMIRLRTIDRDAYQPMVLGEKLAPFIGLVTPAIADIGHGAGKLLLATVGIAFADTILAGLLAYGTGSALFPHMIANSAHVAVDKVEELKPFFEIKIPAMVDVTRLLVSLFHQHAHISHIYPMEA